LIAIISVSSFTFAEGDAKPSQEAVVAQPDPLHLKSSWWDYFNVTGEAYAKRAEDYRNFLVDLQSGLEGEQKESAAVMVRRLISHIEALPALRNNHVEQPSPKPFFDKYTLNQQIELAKHVASIRSGLANEKKEEKFLSNRNRKLADHLDKLIISYRDAEEETFQKFMMGLDILNTRFTYAINEEKLRVVREKKELLENTLKRSQEELKFAQNHSDLSGISIQEVESDLAEMKAKLEMARNNSLIAELKALPVYDNSLQGKLEGSLRQLEEYNLSIKELIAELAVLFQEAKLLIGQVNADQYEGTNEELKSAFTTMSTQLNAIQTQAKQWDQRVDEEFTRFDQIADSDQDLSKEIEKLAQQRAQKIQENRVLLSQIDERIFTTGYVLGQLDQYIVSKQPAMARLFNQSVESVSDCCSRVFSWYDQTLFRLGDQPITIRNLINGLLVLAAAYFISLGLRKLLAKGFKKRHLSHGFIYSINRLIHYTVMSLGIIIALTSIGLDFDRIYLVIGALGVGIGFGLQGIVNNFFSGLIILFTRNFKVGDIVDLETGGCGSVIAINVQNTIIRSFDGIDIVVPNSTLITSKFTNWTRKDPFKRFRIRFCVQFGTDKEKLRQVISECAKQVPATIGEPQGVPNPDCWMTEIGDNGLVFDLVVWANMFKSGEHGSIGTSYVWAVEGALRENGFKIAQPARVIIQPES